MDVRIARGEITGDLFRVNIHGDQIKVTCNNPGFTDFFLSFPQCGKAIQMLIKLAIQANPFRSDGFAVGPAFCVIFELLRRDTFNFKKAGEIIGKAISDACSRTIIEISKWGNMDSVDEIAVGEIFFGTLINACKDKFSGLSENEVRESAFIEDKDLCFIPRTVWQKSVKELTDYPKDTKTRRKVKKAGDE